MVNVRRTFYSSATGNPTPFQQSSRPFIYASFFVMFSLKLAFSLSLYYLCSGKIKIESNYIYGKEIPSRDPLRTGGLDT